MHNEAASKLDYFILGVTLAICAYLAQTNPYAQFGVNKETFLLGSLLVFASSAVCGFKRIESTIAALRMNALRWKSATLKQEHTSYRSFAKTEKRTTGTRYAIIY